MSDGASSSALPSPQAAQSPEEAAEALRNRLETRSKLYPINVVRRAMLLPGSRNCRRSKRRRLWKFSAQISSSFFKALCSSVSIELVERVCFSKRFNKGIGKVDKTSGNKDRKNNIRND